MYAILHLPTGKLLARPNILQDDDTITIYDFKYRGKTLFYSKKDAEAYKRTFLIFYYFIIKIHCETLKIEVEFPKKLAKFLKKRNRFKKWAFTYAAFDLGNRSLDFWLMQRLDNKMIAADVNEFVVVSVKKDFPIFYEALT